MDGTLPAGCTARTRCPLWLQARQNQDEARRQDEKGKRFASNIAQAGKHNPFADLAYTNDGTAPLASVSPRPLCPGLLEAGPG